MSYSAFYYPVKRSCLSIPSLNETYTNMFCIHATNVMFYALNGVGVNCFGSTASPFKLAWYFSVTAVALGMWNTATHAVGKNCGWNIESIRAFDSIEDAICDGALLTTLIKMKMLNPIGQYVLGGLLCIDVAMALKDCIQAIRLKCSEDCRERLVESVEMSETLEYIPPRSDLQAVAVV